MLEGGENGSLLVSPLGLVGHSLTCIYMNIIYLLKTLNSESVLRKLSLLKAELGRSQEPPGCKSSPSHCTTQRV